MGRGLLVDLADECISHFPELPLENLLILATVATRLIDRTSFFFSRSPPFVVRGFFFNLAILILFF